MCLEIPENPAGGRKGWRGEGGKAEKSSVTHLSRLPQKGQRAAGRWAVPRQALWACGFSEPTFGGGGENVSTGPPVPSPMARFTSQSINFPHFRVLPPFRRPRVLAPLLGAVTPSLVSGTYFS